MSRPAGLGEITRYCQETSSGVLRCSTDATKGRILLTTKSSQSGDLLYSEPLLCAALEHPEAAGFHELAALAQREKFLFQPWWYWATLSCLTEADLEHCKVQILPLPDQQQERLLTMSSNEAIPPRRDLESLVTAFWAAADTGTKKDIVGKLALLFGIWTHNCFAHREEPRGYALYYLSSILSHSCRPNCVWYPEGERFVLRARVDLEEGEEVTISYLGDEGYSSVLLESTERRLSTLQRVKQFTCMCQSCTARVDGARGFVCLACKEGELLLHSKGFKAAACARCSFKPTDEQVRSMLEQEATIEGFWEDWERRANRAPILKYMTKELAARLERNLMSFFSPRHWLWDRMRLRLVDFYEASQDFDRAIELAEQSVSFCQEAFPGPSAPYAWRLELLGDLKLRHRGFQRILEDEAEVPPEMGLEELADAQLQVVNDYGRAIDYLLLLYGEEHDYFRSLKQKAFSVEKALMEKRAALLAA